MRYNDIVLYSIIHTHSLFTDFTFSPSAQRAFVNQTLVFPPDGYVDGILNFTLTLSRVASNVTGLSVNSELSVIVIMYDPDGE